MRVQVPPLVPILIMKVENLTDKELQDELNRRKKERLKKEREARKIIGERRYRQVHEEYLKYANRNGQPPNFVILHKDYKELRGGSLFGMHVILLNLEDSKPIVFFDKIK